MLVTRALPTRTWLLAETTLNAPSAVELENVVPFKKALLPKAVLLIPVVLLKRDLRPIAVLLLPEVLL